MTEPVIGTGERPPLLAGRSRRAVGTLSLLVLALAWAALMQQPGPNQNAHLATVTALASGESTIDRYRNWTRDISYVDGHFYAAKAPGLDLLTLPWYVFLDRTGLLVEGSPASVPWPRAESHMPLAAPWQVGLFGATLPGFLLLLLVRWVVERFVPRYGTAAAITVGAGSIVGLLATMYFSHALSACLGFAAFAVLLRERRSGPDTRLVLAAGALAGLAVTVEFPVAIVGAALGLYALARGPRTRRALVYAAGVLVGVLPLFAFNTWVFGSPFSLAYVNAVIEPGVTGHDVVGANSSGFFGVGVPNPYSAAKLLLSAKGVAVLTPVWVLACAGLVTMWRRGWRAEAALVGGLTAAFLVYDAGYYLPFGGFNGGPRFLVPVFPFLALPLAAIMRQRPLTTLALGLVSIVITSVSLVSGPLHVAEDTSQWFHRLRTGIDDQGFITQTVLHRFGRDPDIEQALAVLAVIAVAVVLALLVTPRPPFRRTDLVTAVGGLLLWRIVFVGGPIMFRVDSAEGDWVGAGAAAGLLVAGVLAIVLVARGNRAALVPAALLLPLVWPRAASHTTIALGVVVVALAWLVVLAAREAAMGSAGTSVPSPP